MHSHVSFHGTRLSETLTADFARERLLTRVRPRMRPQVARLGKRFVADAADPRPFAKMHRLHVPTQTPAELEPHRALRAREGLLARVDPHVTPQVPDRGERGTAAIATIAFHAGMDERV